MLRKMSARLGFGFKSAVMSIRHCDNIDEPEGGGRTTYKFRTAIVIGIVTSQFLAFGGLVSARPLLRPLGPNMNVSAVQQVSTMPEELRQR